MFPPDNLAGYLQLSFSKKLEELSKRYAQRVADASRANPSKGGHRIKAILQPSIENARERVEARLELIRETCKHANHPIDDEVRAYMASEAHNLCESSRKHVAQNARLVVLREGLTPPGLLESVLAQLDHQILSIDSNVQRDLKIEELAAKAQSDASSNRPAPDETKILVPAPPPEHSSRAIPWYKENPFWGNLGVFLTLSIAGVSFRLGGYPLFGRILMWLSWLFGLVSLGIMVPNLSSERRVKYVAIAGACVLFTVLFYMADNALSRHSQPGAVAGFMQVSTIYVRSNTISTNEPLSINVGIKNHGMTPVQNMYWFFEASLVPVQGDVFQLDKNTHAGFFADALKQLNRRFDAHDAGLSVGVGDEAWDTLTIPNPPDPPLTEEQVNEVMQGRYRLYVYVWSRWRNAASDLDFCEWLQPPTKTPFDNHDLVWHRCAE